MIDKAQSGGRKRFAMQIMSGIALLALGGLLGVAVVKPKTETVETLATESPAAAVASDDAEALRAALAAAQENISALERELQAAQDKSATPAPEEPKPWPAPPTPNSVVLQDLTVVAKAGVWTANMQFTPTRSNALESFALIVRLPPTSDAKIVGIANRGDAQYSDARQRISEDGHFAAFQGMPADLTPLQFELSVSAPVTASVLGTCGVVPFTIEFSD